MVLESSARPQTRDTHMKLRHIHILPPGNHSTPLLFSLLLPETNFRSVFCLKNLSEESHTFEKRKVPILNPCVEVSEALKSGLILSAACWLVAAALRCAAFIPLRSPLIRLPPPPWPSEVLREAFEAQPHQSAETAPPSLPSWEPGVRRDV